MVSKGITHIIRSIGLWNNMADASGTEKRRNSQRFRSIASGFRNRVSKMGKGLGPNRRLPSFRRLKGKGKANTHTAEQQAQVEAILESFRLEGGPSQAALVVAKSGDRMVGGITDRDLVHLTWYRATAGGVFERIRGIHGGFYQPSVDDAGARVCVQCTSALDAAQAAFAEIGPIEIGA